MEKSTPFFYSFKETLSIYSIMIKVKILENGMYLKAGEPDRGQEELQARAGMEEDKLPGGAADDMPDDKFNAKELARGLNHEKEHTVDDKIADEIAKDHMKEDPKYYTHLKAKGIDECGCGGCSSCSAPTIKIVINKGSTISEAFDPSEMAAIGSLAAIVAGVGASMAVDKASEFIKTFKKMRQKRAAIEDKIKHDRNVAEIAEILKGDISIYKLIMNKEYDKAVTAAKEAIKSRKDIDQTGVARAIFNIKSILY